MMVSLIWLIIGFAKPDNMQSVCLEFHPIKWRIFASPLNLSKETAIETVKTQILLSPTISIDTIQFYTDKNNNSKADIWKWRSKDGFTSKPNTVKYFVSFKHMIWASLFLFRHKQIEVEVAEKYPRQWETFLHTASYAVVLRRRERAVIHVQTTSIARKSTRHQRDKTSTFW